MKHAELVKTLKTLGVTVTQGKKHLKLRYGDKRSTVVRHPTQEVSPEILKNIKRQLGLK